MPLRVLTSHDDEEYHRVIYDALAGTVLDSGIYPVVSWDDARLEAELSGWDAFHLHWPEWFLVPEPAMHRRFVAALRSARVPIVWSQHNLEPHNASPASLEIYSLWAAAADGVIHHSAWGAAKARAALQYRQDCLHRVIAHPHFGRLRADHGSRREIEKRLAWRSDRLRLLIVGSPRPSKRVADVVLAFHASARHDIEFRVFSLDTEDVVTSDSRVHTERYARVDRALYDDRLAASDALVMPFHDTNMLTTGTVADAVAHGLPCLTSEWPFLAEVLGPAGIVYGQRAADLTAAVDGLDQTDLAKAAVAAVALQAKYDPGQVAIQVLDLLAAVAAGKSR